jgi:hypothetical protein
MVSHMSSVYSLSATWAETLESLRRKSNCYTPMECPLGAELQAMSVEQKEAIFDRPRLSLNDTRLGAIDIYKANQYLKGLIEHTESFEGFGDLSG